MGQTSFDPKPNYLVWAGLGQIHFFPFYQWKTPFEITPPLKLPQEDDMCYQILHQLGRASKLLGCFMSKFLKFLASYLLMLFVIFCDPKDQLCIKFSLGKHELKKYKLQVIMA